MTTHPQRILLANALAADYFRDCLHSSIGDGPRGYLQGRGVSDRALRGRDWEIGYAPPGWTGLVARLRSGPWPFTDQELLDSGLALATRRGTLIDRFRDRVMFGVLHGIDSRMVGFVGRCAPHSGDDTPKYLNSPNGPVYNKNHHLFGLAEQRSVLQDGARPLLVEGPLDVLSASGLGLEVAPVSACGTALSVRQANQLEPFLRGGGLVAYDGDEAGGRAALNAYERLSTYTDEIRGVQLPSGEDPASLAVSAPHILAGLLQTAPPLAELLVHSAVAPFLNRLENAEIRVSALHAATRLLARLQPAEAAGQVAWLSERLGFSPREVSRDLMQAVTEAAASFTTSRQRGSVHSLAARCDANRSLRL